MSAQSTSRKKSPPRRPPSKKVKATVPRGHQVLGRSVRRLQGFIKRPHVRRILKAVLLWGVAWAVLTSFYLVTVMKNDNYLELFPREIIFVLTLHAVTGFLIMFAVWILCRRLLFATKLLAVVGLALVMVNYDERLMNMSDFLRVLAPLLPNQNEFPVLSVLFLILIGVTIRVLARAFDQRLRRQKIVLPQNLVWGILVVITFVFVGQARRVWAVWQPIARQSVATTPTLGPSPAAPTDKPDIYYLVFDRYANEQVLREQFGFDNTLFVQSLKEQGFYVNAQATTHYPYTAMSVASTLNASYHTSALTPFLDNAVQSRTLYHNLIHTASVTRALKDAGYTYHHLGSWYGATNEAPMADVSHIYEHSLVIGGKERKRLRGLESSAFRQSPYYRFTQVGGLSWWPFQGHEFFGSTMPKAQLTTLRSLSTQKPGGRFIFAHILLPHDPFYFHADGSLSSNIGSNDEGKPIKQKYLDQVQFVNGQINSLVATIRQHSNGQAVILLNADEGPYPHVLNTSFLGPTGVEGTVAGNMNEWPEDWLHMKYGILQAVHIPRATPEDYAHLSSVNLFRIVLNRYLGYNLRYLPECHFGLRRGGVYGFDFAPIDMRLVGRDEPACQQFDVRSPQ